MSRRTLAALYLLAQAGLVAAWWSVLWWWPSARAPFLIASDWPETTLLAFALPDLAVIVAGSAAAAAGLRAGRPWASPLLWFVAGAVGYATLWCIGANLVTGSGYLCTAMMLASAVGTGWALGATKP